MNEATLSQKEIQNILHREDYFYCTREQCSMRKTLCIQFQKQAKVQTKRSYSLGFNKSISSAARYNCINCPQGKLIKQELEEKGIIKKRRRRYVSAKTVT